MVGRMKTFKSYMKKEGEKMDKFVDQLLKHRKTVIAFYVIAAIICTFLSSFVSVNYTMADYLPDESASTIAINTMNDEYDAAIPNAHVMIEDVTIPEALQLKEKLSQVDGIEDVTWLDDSVDITQPLETIDTDVLETYYKDDYANFTVTINEDKVISARHDIEKITDKNISMSGDAISTAIATEDTETEITKIAIIAIVIIFAILFLTTTSWAEPVIFMITIGIAVLINRGTNLIFGEISFVSNAAGSILQLAVSMDYSIFLMNRFNDYRKNGKDIFEAMKEAVIKSFSSISASALTTVIGFLALVLMRFKIGVDLGLVMAKAVMISIIAVFTLLPAIIVSSYRIIDKLEHRPFTPSFRSFSKLVMKIKKPMIVIFIILIIPGYILQTQNSFYYGSSHIYGEGTAYYNDTEKIKDIFGESNSMALMVPLNNTAKQEQLSKELKSLPYVSDVISYVDLAGASVPKEYLEKDDLSQLDSDNHTRFVLTVETPSEGDKAFQAVEEIRDIAHQYYGDDYKLAGDTVSTYDMRDVTTADMNKVNTVAIVAVFLVILLTTRSVFTPLVLVLVIEGAIWVNLAVPACTNEPLFYIAYLIISSVQLGATVDYAICLSDRYIETRKTKNRKDALDHTIRYTTLSILTSGSILTLCGFILGKISTHGILAEIGVLLFRGTLCSLIFVLFVLPGLLYVLDKPILKFRFAKDRKEVFNDEEK